MLDECQRILVIGCSGAGKSTFARRLGVATGLPVVHLDVHFWQPGWKPTPDDEWAARLEELLVEPRWIMEGNYHLTLPRRLQCADAVIHIDLPRRLCLARIFKRLLWWWGRTRVDIAPGCREGFDWPFLTWVWSFHREVRPAVLATLEAAPSEVEVITLRSRREVREFLS
ncbi:MAG: P-loop NTPase family protein [Planctomycetota bacterium]